MANERPRSLWRHEQERNKKHRGIFPSMPFFILHIITGNRANVCKLFRQSKKPRDHAELSAERNVTDVEFVDSPIQ